MRRFFYFTCVYSIEIQGNDCTLKWFHCQGRIPRVIRPLGETLVFSYVHAQSDDPRDTVWGEVVTGASDFQYNFFQILVR